MADDRSYKSIWQQNVAKLSILGLYMLANLSKVMASDQLVEMKIVDEPSSYGFGNAGQQWGGVSSDTASKLKMRVQPANISGPPHLFHLHKKCFSKILENYKYNFCPFSNVTQHEQGYHWNPYNGVLGVWQEWEVQNNTYISMEMQEGDDCGQIRRSIKVRLICGNSSDIISVTEPSTCHYVMVFTTPLVCHPQSLLVYPTLLPQHRSKWDVLESSRHRNELTEKGYKKRLQMILEEAGLRLSAKQRQQLSAVVAAKEEEEQKNHALNFNSLAHCTQMYRLRQQEVELLKAELEKYKSNSSDAELAQYKKAETNGNDHAHDS